MTRSSGSTGSGGAGAARNTPAKKAAAKKAVAKKAVAKKAVPKKVVASTSETPELAVSASATSSRVADSPREMRRQQRIEVSREQILDTAEALFAERGYHDTGLKDVAMQCEFSVGSIYLFFANKDSLYEQVLMRRSDDMEAMQESIPPEVPADQRLVRLAELRIEHAHKYPAWGALTAELSRLTRTRGSVMPDAWVHFGKKTLHYLADLIERGQAEGTLRPGSPMALARLYNAVVTSFILVDAMSYVNKGLETWPSDSEEFLNFLHDTFSSSPEQHSTQFVDD